MIFSKTVKVSCGFATGKGLCRYDSNVFKLIHQIAKPQNQASCIGKIVLEEFGIAILMVIYTIFENGELKVNLQKNLRGYIKWSSIKRTNYFNATQRE